MSTRSLITVKNIDDDKYYTVYCHYDGYPEHHLPILTEYYNTYEKALELISLGDMSGLYENIDEIQYYHRNKKEEWKYCKPKVDIYDSENECMDVSYEYIFEDNKWIYR